MGLRISRGGAVAAGLGLSSIGSSAGGHEAGSENCAAPAPLARRATFGPPGPEGEEIMDGD